MKCNDFFLIVTKTKNKKEKLENFPFLLSENIVCVGNLPKLWVDF